MKILKNLFEKLIFYDIIDTIHKKYIFERKY